eukprot:CAMPEP_0204374344 /NCGR_PEP_ID=MMETSP0469-20131031/48592_1 /ASSEMBLY_ACC=CAM_ASM_000384 /TAXON_ID=2969 /ORGANISM="Oxyrrhis marina" /LENGTH=124 /DNA_ID=CAMNT_0051364913 /DNA_START=222 /DNA_END=596 /DNA_ORIENTATION=-
MQRLPILVHRQHADVPLFFIPRKARATFLLKKAVAVGLWHPIAAQTTAPLLQLHQRRRLLGVGCSDARVALVPTGHGQLSAVWELLAKGTLVLPLVTVWVGVTGPRASVHAHSAKEQGLVALLV